MIEDIVYYVLFHGGYGYLPYLVEYSDLMFPLTHAGVLSSTVSGLQFTMFAQCVFKRCVRTCRLPHDLSMIFHRF